MQFKLQPPEHLHIALYRHRSNSTLPSYYIVYMTIYVHKEKYTYGHSFLKGLVQLRRLDWVILTLVNFVTLIHLYALVCISSLYSCPHQKISLYCQLTMFTFVNILWTLYSLHTDSVLNKLYKIFSLYLPYYELASKLAPNALTCLLFADV